MADSRGATVIMPDSEVTLRPWKIELAHKKMVLEFHRYNKTKYVNIAEHELLSFRRILNRVLEHCAETGILK